MRGTWMGVVAAVTLAAAPVQAQQAGTLASSTPVVPPRDALAGPVQAWKITYWTRDAQGRPRQVSGIVVAPANRMGGPRPVIAWAHGTWGVANKCAPSSSANFFAATPALSEMVARGYTVVAPDYPGLGSAGAHPYLVGIDTGRAVLDAVRAARAVPGASAGGRFAVWGESQGGHAALWAGQLARSYAPGLELVGIAAAAPPTELAANLGGSTNKAVRAMLTAFTAYSWGRHYGVPLKSLGNKQTQGIVTRLAQNNCIDLEGKPKLGTVLGIAVLQQRLARIDLGTLPPWSRFAAANSVSPQVTAPLLIAQSVEDPIVSPRSPAPSRWPPAGLGPSCGTSTSRAAIMRPARSTAQASRSTGSTRGLLASPRPTTAGVSDMAERFERHKQPWTGEELGKLKILAAKGKGLKEIAKALGRSEESTKDRAKIDGIGIAKLR